MASTLVQYWNHREWQTQTGSHRHHVAFIYPTDDRKKRGGGCDVYVKGWWDRPHAENRAPAVGNPSERSAVFHWCWWGIHNLNFETWISNSGLRCNTYTK
jgi:hypothetical protein